MAKINYQIGSRAFELIRNQIAVILKTELDNQILMDYLVDLDADIYVGRTRPFALADMPAINVDFASNNYSNKDFQSVDNNCTFFIDVYMGYESEENETFDYGDQLASINCQKLLGICQAILDNQEYSTLDFAPPFICTTKCDSIQIADAKDGDNSNTRMGRLTFSVRVAENNTLGNGNIVSLSTSQYTIGESEKGYLIIT